MYSILLHGTTAGAHMLEEAFFEHLA